MRGSTMECSVKGDALSGSLVCLVCGGRDADRRGHFAEYFEVCGNDGIGRYEAGAPRSPTAEPSGLRL